MEPGEQKKARQDVFEFDQHPEDAATVLKFFLNIMLYHPLTRSQQEQEGPIIYPGLSAADVENITNKGKVTWTSSKINEAKVYKV